METVGDKYMLASGLPEKSSLHAKNIALVALDMIDIARDIVVADGEFPVRVSTPTTSRSGNFQTGECKTIVWPNFIIRFNNYGTRLPHTSSELKKRISDWCVIWSLWIFSLHGP